MIRTVVVVALAVTSAAHPAGAAPPGEARGLVIAPPTATLYWTQTPGATEYHVHRGDRASNPDIATGTPESCLLGSFDVAESGPILDISPPTSNLHWYVVRAANVDGEGTVGAGRSPESWGGCCGETAFAESFSGPDGSAWHPRWSRTFEADVADLEGGAARFRPRVSSYSLARLYSHARLSEVDATFRVRFENLARQGVGFYVRSNAGYLTTTSPPGQGYATFIEGFRGGRGIGVWKEQAGSEIELQVNYDPGPGLVLTDGVDYRVRFRVTQETPTSTRLETRIWRDGTGEPTAWDVSRLDTTPELQGISGGVGLDSWSSINPSTPGGPTPMFTFVDDIRIQRLCNPTAGVTAAEVIAESFQFTEGPLWRDDALLFTDIQADTIYELVGAGPATTYRAPSSQANGLANDLDGDLLACEHASRRVSRTDGGGSITTLVDNYGGLRFNSPNDLAVHGDGTVYFTDPAYGLAVPTDREIPFNGLFRLAPGGALTAEWEGAVAASGPNGVALSPDQRILYMSDSEAGEVRAFDVQVDGSLGGERVFASGLTTPDGMCVDMAGNLYVATWASRIEVFAPDGTRVGLLPVPRDATNCAFGGADRLSLYVTAQVGLYRFAMPHPGQP